MRIKRKIVLPTLWKDDSPVKIHLQTCRFHNKIPCKTLLQSDSWAWSMHLSTKSSFWWTNQGSPYSLSTEVPFWCTNQTHPHCFPKTSEWHYTSLRGGTKSRRGNLPLHQIPTPRIQTIGTKPAEQPLGWAATHDNHRAEFRILCALQPLGGRNSPPPSDTIKPSAHISKLCPLGDLQIASIFYSCKTYEQMASISARYNMHFFGCLLHV